MGNIPRRYITHFCLYNPTHNLMNSRLAYFGSRFSVVFCLFFWLSNAPGQMEAGVNEYDLALSNRPLPEMLLELKVTTGIELEVVGQTDFNRSLFSVVGSDLSLDEIIKKVFKDYDYVTMGSSGGTDKILILVTGFNGANISTANSLRNEGFDTDVELSGTGRLSEQELQNIIAQIELNEAGTLKELNPADDSNGNVNIMENGIQELIPDGDNREGENILQKDYELNYTEEGILELITVDEHGSEYVKENNYIQDFTGPGGELELIRVDDHKQARWETFTGPEGITEAILIKTN